MAPLSGSASGRKGDRRGGSLPTGRGSGFVLDETRVLRTLEGAFGSLEGDRISVTQVAGLQIGSEVVVADVKIDVPRLTEIRTRISAPAGETVILAQVEVALGARRAEERIRSAVERLPDDLRRVV